MAANDFDLGKIDSVIRDAITPGVMLGIRLGEWSEKDLEDHLIGAFAAAIGDPTFGRDTDA